MKKYISVILVLLMFSQVSVLAYSDITDAQFAAKVENLSEYNIINGYEDGTFRPYDNITRAEFCKLIMCATMNDYVGEYEKCFTDVENGFWAENYIYAAKMLGIVNGTTETTFEPEANITNEQAVKMIVCALGYGEEANDLGGYPNGYIRVAENLGIISEGFVGEKVATRQGVAEMVYNILDVEYYFISLSDDGVIEKSKSGSTLREYHEFLNDGGDDESGENAVG